MKCFHVTPRANLKPIFQDRTGLVPLLGPRSQKSNETIPGVFLLKTASDLETALSSWLVELFGETERLALIGVNLDADLRRIEGAPYEIQVLEAISIAALHLLIANLDACNADQIADIANRFENQRPSGRHLPLSNAHTARSL